MGLFILNKNLHKDTMTSTGNVFRRPSPYDVVTIIFFELKIYAHIL